MQNKSLFNGYDHLVWIFSSVLILLLGTGAVFGELIRKNDRNPDYLEKGTSAKSTTESSEAADVTPLQDLNWLRNKAANEEMDRRKLQIELRKTRTELEESTGKVLELSGELEKTKDMLDKLKSQKFKGGQPFSHYYLKKGYYEVKDGDSLWKIAKRGDVFGNALKWPELYYENKTKMENPNVVFPGQVLHIPTYYLVDEIATIASEVKNQSPEEAQENKQSGNEEEKKEEMAL